MKLFLGNLNWKATEDDIRRKFGQFGVIRDIKLISDRDTGKPRGFGFITYETKDEARIAIREMDGAEFMGRNVRVNEAEDRR